MKSIIVVLFSFMMFACAPLNQVSQSTNYGNAPQWGPAGYDDARYYYLPDIEAYYDIHYNVFIYYSGNTWVRRSYLPSRYRDYNLYDGYKVVITDYNGNSPYSNFNEYKLKYKKGYRGHEQRNIGVRTENSDNRRKVTEEVRTERKVINTERKKDAKVKNNSSNRNSESNRKTEKKSNNRNNNGRR